MLGMFVSSVVVAFIAGAMCFGTLGAFASYNLGFQKGYVRGLACAIMRSRAPYTRLEVGR